MHFIDTYSIRYFGFTYCIQVSIFARHSVTFIKKSNQNLNSQNIYSGRAIKWSELVCNLTATCEYSNTVSLDFGDFDWTLKTAIQWSISHRVLQGPSRTSIFWPRQLEYKSHFHSLKISLTMSDYLPCHYYPIFTCALTYLANHSLPFPFSPLHSSPKRAFSSWSKSSLWSHGPKTRLVEAMQKNSLLTAGFNYLTIYQIDDLWIWKVKSVKLNTGNVSIWQLCMDITLNSIKKENQTCMIELFIKFVLIGNCQ